MWIERTAKDGISRAVAVRPCVLLTGLRQTGKSSLLQRMFPKATYLTFDHVQNVEEAEHSPHQFLRRLRPPVILDEFQYVPGLLREIKILIDENRKLAGQWILTGSQRFTLMREVGESLAGRVTILSLGALTPRELRASDYFDTLAVERFVWRGGFPELWATEHLAETDFYESYIQTYLERDLRIAADIANLREFRRFLQAVAIRVGNLLNLSDMARDVGIAQTTARQWINALESSGVLVLLPPYYRNLGKRMIKTPKVYFADHGLAAYLLHAHSRELWEGHPMRGGLWENLVLCTMLHDVSLEPGRTIFFFRDSNGLESDFVVDLGKKVVLVEAKTSERENPQSLPVTRIAKLFHEKETSVVVACRCDSEEPVHTGGGVLYNPLRHDFPGVGGHEPE